MLPLRLSSLPSGADVFTASSLVRLSLTTTRNLVFETTGKDVKDHLVERLIRRGYLELAGRVSTLVPEGYDAGSWPERIRPHVDVRVAVIFAAVTIAEAQDLLVSRLAKIAIVGGSYPLHRRLQKDWRHERFHPQDIDIFVQDVRFGCTSFDIRKPKAWLDEERTVRRVWSVSRHAERLSTSASTVEACLGACLEYARTCSRQDEVRINGGGTNIKAGPWDLPFLRSAERTATGG